MSLKSSLILGTIGGFAGCILTWLLMSHTSPVHSLVPISVSNYWGYLNFPVFVVFILFGLPDNEVLLNVVTFFYWFLIVSVPALILGAIIKGLRDGR